MHIHNHRIFTFISLLILCSPTIAMEVPEKRLKIEEECELGEQLVKAAKKGNLEQVNVLLGAGAPIDYVSKQKPALVLSPLESAAYFGHQRVCEMLVEKMAAIPSDEQKTRLYTFLNCFKHVHPAQYSNLRNLFKPYLHMLIVEENFENCASLVREQISRIVYICIDPHDQSEKVKQYLLQRYCNQGAIEDQPACITC